MSQSYPWKGESCFERALGSRWIMEVHCSTASPGHTWMPATQSSLNEAETLLVVFVTSLSDEDGWHSAPSSVPVGVKLNLAELVRRSGSHLCKLPASNRKCFVLLCKYFITLPAGTNSPLLFWKAHMKIYTHTHRPYMMERYICHTLWVFCNHSFLLVHLTHFILRRPCALCSLHLRIRNCSDSDFYAWIRTLQGTVILKSQIQVGQSQLPAADWIL